MALDGRVVLMSRGSRRTMRVSDLSSIAGRLWWDLWPKEERPALCIAFELATLGEVAAFRVICPDAAGRPAPWDLTLRPVIGCSGQITRILATSEPGEPKMAPPECRKVEPPECRKVDTPRMMRKRRLYRILGAGGRSAAVPR